MTISKTTASEDKGQKPLVCRMGPPDTVCAFSVDVESFAESHAQSVRVPKEFLDTASMDREIENNLNELLPFLESHGVRGTFFFLGRIAQSAPHLVRSVADRGHEIGCHSLHHLRITGQTREAFGTQLKEAKSALEDVSGQRVIGFRAPDFSVGSENPWAFDELMEAGFRYDSSVVPTQIHDIYGMTGVPKAPFRWPCGLVEFPLPIMRIFGVGIPVGGGGYFRLFPEVWTKRFFARSYRQSRPSVFYIHPYELGSEAPRLAGLSIARRFRHYVRLRKGRRRLAPMISEVPFAPVGEVLTRLGLFGDTNS